MFGLLLALLLVETPEPPPAEPPAPAHAAQAQEEAPAPKAPAAAQPAAAPAAAEEEAPRQSAAPPSGGEPAAGTKAGVDPTPQRRPAAPPRPAAPAAAQEPTPAPPTLRATPAAGPDDADPALLQVVGAFFAGLHQGHPVQVTRLCDTPFRLEGETIEEATELQRRWREALRGRPWADHPLFGVEALPLAEMVRLHGPPPKRLGAVEGDDLWVGIANVGGTPAVAVFRKTATGWRAIAYTD